MWHTVRASFPIVFLPVMQFRWAQQQCRESAQNPKGQPRPVASCAASVFRPGLESSSVPIKLRCGFAAGGHSIATIGSRRRLNLPGASCSRSGQQSVNAWPFKTGPRNIEFHGSRRGTPRTPLRSSASTFGSRMGAFLIRSAWGIGTTFESSNSCLVDVG